MPFAERFANVVFGALPGPAVYGDGLIQRLIAVAVDFGDCLPQTKVFGTARGTSFHLRVSCPENVFRNLSVPTGGPTLMGVLLGYARVSTADQTTEGQITALKAAGCQHVWTEVTPGACTRRSILDELVATATEGTPSW